MIKFFRKIRQKLIVENRFSKYLLYAIGEIILVMIGILLALQVNNWNESRKQNRKQKAMLTKFSQDLIEDYTNYKTYAFETSQIDSLHQSLFDFILNKSSQTLKHPELIRRSVFFNPVSRDNNPNITTEVDNDDIRKSIQEYFRDINETRNSVMEYRAVIVQMRDYLRKKEAHNFSDWSQARQFTNVISRNDLSKLATEAFFQQLLFEASLKLNEVSDQIKGIMLTNKNTMKIVLDYVNTAK